MTNVTGTETMAYVEQPLVTALTNVSLVKPAQLSEVVVVNSDS